MEARSSNAHALLPPIAEEVQAGAGQDPRPRTGRAPSRHPLEEDPRLAARPPHGRVHGQGAGPTGGASCAAEVCAPALGGASARRSRMNEPLVVVDEKHGLAAHFGSAKPESASSPEQVHAALSKHAQAIWVARPA